MTVTTKEIQSKSSAQEVLEILKEGNQRFVNQDPKSRNLLEQVNTTSTGQFPLAVVISCIDSRVPTEMIFDQGIGDIFCVRVAGNVINQDVLGSVEFACKVAGVKLIVVMGHTSCGAVKGACNDVELGNLTGLLNKIKPAISIVANRGVAADDAGFVDEVALENVQISLDTILNDSPVIKEMVDNHEVKCAKAMYSVQTGEVELNLL
ncbi:MAG: carbonic anhydrase family protein [Bacteroidetes bacterium]|jgi:carbonic anhydrase|nr:carbonic anhydrase family protein [Bacteroidota bacterium]